MEKRRPDSGLQCRPAQRMYGVQPQNHPSGGVYKQPGIPADPEGDLVGEGGQKTGAEKRPGEPVRRGGGTGACRERGVHRFPSGRRL